MLIIIWYITESLLGDGIKNVLLWNRHIQGARSKQQNDSPERLCPVGAICGDDGRGDGAGHRKAILIKLSISEVYLLTIFINDDTIAVG